MQPVSGQLAQFLGGNIKYVVPPFQRPYQWEELQWYEIVQNTLDVFQKPKNENGVDRSHWLGIQLVATPDTGIELGRQTWELIDGQQRLITLITWLYALRDHARDYGGKPLASDPIENMATVEVQASDQHWFAACVKGLWKKHYDSETGAHGPLRAYVYFRFLLWGGRALLDLEEPPKLPKLKRTKGSALLGVEEFWSKRLEADQTPHEPISPDEAMNMIQVTLKQFSWLQLQREQLDAPAAELFRALNGDGLKLRPFDFVRNMLFVKLPAERAQQIYADKWELAEQSIFEATWTGKRFDAPSIFLYDFLISKGASAKQGSINRAKGNEHFAVFVSHFKPEELARFIEVEFVPAMKSWLQVVSSKAGPFGALENLLHETRTLSAGPLDPALLYLLELHRTGALSLPQVESRIRGLQSVVVRMILSDQPLNNLRSKVMNVMPKLQEDSSERAWHDALTSIGWISDEEVLRKIEELELYGIKANPRQLLVLFRGAEQELAGKGANPLIGGKESAQYSIEHLLPSSVQDAWRSQLDGSSLDYEAAYKLRNTLGNLTPLTNEHNKRVGTKLLTEKAACLNDASILGYQEPPLRLHESWTRGGHATNVWGAEAIKARTNLIAQLMLNHWSEIK